MKEKILVIGGGLTGALTAIQLAKTGMYKVVLLEAKSQIFNGASQVAYQVHFGGHYPCDLDTAMECLKGGIIFRQMLPDIYVKEPSIDLLVTKKTEVEGDLNIKQLVQHYNLLKLKYSEYFQKNMESEFLPHPSKFFRELSPEEYKHTNGIVGGVKASERGVNPVLLGCFLKECLEHYQVEVLTNHKVFAVKKKPNCFQIHVRSKDIEKTIEAEQVVNASFHGAFELNNQIDANPVEKLKIYLRGMFVADISNSAYKPAPIMGFLGEHGGAYYPINNKMALLYHPSFSGSYLGEVTLDKSSPHIPSKSESMIQQGIINAKEKKDMVLSNLTKIYPFLEGSKIIDLLVRPAVSANSQTAQRRQIDVNSIEDKNSQWINAISVKATTAGLISLQVLKLVQKKSLEKGLINKEDLSIPNNNVPISLPEHLRLSKELQLDKQFIERARTFAIEIGFPSEFVESESHSDPIKFWGFYPTRNSDKTLFPNLGKFIR